MKRPPPQLFLGQDSDLRSYQISDLILRAWRTALTFEASTSATYECHNGTQMTKNPGK